MKKCRRRSFLAVFSCLGLALAGCGRLALQSSVAASNLDSVINRALQSGGSGSSTSETAIAPPTPPVPSFVLKTTSLQSPYSGAALGALNEVNDQGISQPSSANANLGIVVNGNYAAADASAGGGQCTPAAPPTPNPIPEFAGINLSLPDANASSSALQAIPLPMAKNAIAVLTGADPKGAVASIAGLFYFPQPSASRGSQTNAICSGQTANSAPCALVASDLPAPDANGNLLLQICDSLDGSTCNSARTPMLDGRGEPLASISVQAAAQSDNQALQVTLDQGCGQRAYY